ncbi:hypothetical protein T07_4357 [Trichinella nelsoni]|uniref:Uncharacterized protein n=1 Tax=Trichinella nelsoni TaxID=6336 RepID=A0A0V0S5J8_9BILA|nr:hypothetical protein T07_4357 [Trichinella nelsoni]
MIHHSSEQHKKKVPINFNAVSFGRIAAPPEQIQGTCILEILYSLHRHGRTHVFNYDSTVIKKDMADKQEMYPLQLHKRKNPCLEHVALFENLWLLYVKSSVADESKQLGTELDFVKLGTRYFVLFTQDWKRTKPGAISSKITKNFAGGVAPSIPCGVAWGVACGYHFENLEIF